MEFKPDSKDKNESVRFDIEKAISVARYWVNFSAQQQLLAKSAIEKKNKDKQYLKYKKILDILESIKDQNLQTNEEVIALLQKDCDELQGKMKESPDDESAEEDYASTLDTINFVAEDSVSKAINSQSYQKWESSLSATNTQAKVGLDDSELQERRKRLYSINVSGTVSDAREKVLKKFGDKRTNESGENLERVLELVLKDGGVRVHTSVEQSLSAKGNSGFQNLETRIKDGLQPRSTLGVMESQFYEIDKNTGRAERMDEILRKHNIKEVINIRREIKEIYEDVIVSGKKGVLGFGSTPDRVEKKPTGRFKPVLHSEIVDAGNNEPAVRFTYYIPQQTDWRDYSGRGGQVLIAEIVLPESTAKELEKTLDSDPIVIRKIIEKLMKEKLLKDRAAWENPQIHGDSLRPPYEKWDAEPEGGIYIQKETEKGFHKESLRSVK